FGVSESDRLSNSAVSPGNNGHFSLEDSACFVIFQIRIIEIPFRHAITLPGTVIYCALFPNSILRPNIGEWSGRLKKFRIGQYSPPTFLAKPSCLHRRPIPGYGFCHNAEGL